MKKTFILLLLAAGAGLFLLLNSQCKHNDGNPQRQSQITGRWKLDSIDVSHATNTSGALMAALLYSMNDGKPFHFDFKANGLIVESLTDSTHADSSHYEWVNDSLLNIRDAADSIQPCKIDILNANRLVLHATKDGITYYFSR